MIDTTVNSKQHVLRFMGKVQLELESEEHEEPIHDGATRTALVFIRFTKRYVRHTDHYDIELEGETASYNIESDDNDHLHDQVERLCERLKKSEDTMSGQV